MEDDTINVEVIWRGKKMNVEVNPRWNLRNIGEELVKITDVLPNTLKLIVSHANKKGARMLAPFSDDDSSLRIHETGIVKGKPVRMLGVFDDEIKEASSDNMRPDLRIAGFEEEDNRLRQLSSYKSQVPIKLPQGPYTFCDFRALELPGIMLNPSPSKALRIMHILACDQGIIAIMRKHQWRVGIMTELAPVGYVGISPKCILGFNKNHGEEISLRLRTDDLKGFRKFESIKKTLLHELAHMVHSEHDTKFLSLEKQLNEEAASLDWSKSKSRTLSGHRALNHYEDDIDDYLGSSTDVGQKLGGSISSATARASSVAAAHSRYLNSSSTFTEANDFPITHNHLSDPMKIEEMRSQESNFSFDMKSENIESKKIEEPAAVICTRIQESIKALRSGLSPRTVSSVLQTLSKIIRNILEHPDELKFRRIRKSNAQFQKHIASHKAAMEVLRTVGFSEDAELNVNGDAETFLVLKRNDPGLLWLVKSSLEMLIS